jgi:pimeloyl-ACP methyl ester carboxylesterase
MPSAAGCGVARMRPDDLDVVASERGDRLFRGRRSKLELVMVGDDDEVRLEHAVAMYPAIPDAELMVVPGTSHGLLVEKPDLCNNVIRGFLIDDPVPTSAPIRRAS